MLRDCRAFVFAHTPIQTRSLTVLAERAGFGAVASTLAAETPDTRTPAGGVPFFLVHHRLSDAAKASVLGVLRGNPQDNVRYAPVIMIVDDCPVATMLRYVQFGFDDVIALPEKRAVIAERLARQLNFDQHYIESMSYLGPDRQRFEVAPEAELEGAGDQAVAKLRIRRTVAHGCYVVSRQFVSRPSVRQVTTVGW